MKTTLVAIALFSVASVAQAAPVSETVRNALSKYAQSHFQGQTRSARLITQCENFTGTYAVSCKGFEKVGVSAPETVKIEQEGCHSLKVDGSDLFIGALESGQAGVPAFLAAGGMAGTQWNEAANEVLLTTDGLITLDAPGGLLSAQVTLGLRKASGGAELRGKIALGFTPEQSLEIPLLCSLSAR